MFTHSVGEITTVGWIRVPAILLGAVSLWVFAAPAAGQQARQPSIAAQAALRGWNADVDGDGRADVCQIVSQPGSKSQSVSYRLTCRLSATGRTIGSETLDIGYPEGRAFVDVDGDRKQDYCRVVGDGSRNSRVMCTLSAGTSFGRTVTSPSLDAGYPDTREWRDVNGDRRADFCRATGINRELFSCTFSDGVGFGRTVTSRR
jgi:hypothetical protein